MEGLWEDVSCSICLDTLDNPVSIKCGHNFCHQCLSKYWDEVLAEGEVTQCPECRQPCARDHVMPDTRLRRMVEKIIEMEQKAPPALPEPIKAVQVMDVDKDQHLLTNEEALSCCLEQETVRSSPVCLISIIGEQRSGKSFLMSHMLHQLRHQKASDNSWMTWEEEAESSFPFQDGMDTVTKGVWMWPQPLWVQGPQGKVAVFLVDTEGSLDLQQHMETSIKLCVFSILLSSYQIFNISSKFKRSEEDYLEMFIKVTREVGDTCNLNPLQHLDLLVRDWQLSHDYGAEGGRKYLDHIQANLRKSPGHDTVLQVLQAETTQCYLLPHPGMRFIGKSEGTLADMSEPFRHHLRAYVTGVVDSAGTSFRTNSKGNMLTGGELMERIKLPAGAALSWHQSCKKMGSHGMGHDAACQGAILARPAVCHDERLLLHDTGRVGGVQAGPRSRPPHHVRRRFRTHVHRHGRAGGEPGSNQTRLRCTRAVASSPGTQGWREPRGGLAHTS